MKLSKIKDAALLAVAAGVAYAVYKLYEWVKEHIPEVKLQVPEYKGWVSVGEGKRVEVTSREEVESEDYQLHPPQYWVSPDEYFQADPTGRLGYLKEADLCAYSASSLGYTHYYYGVKGGQPGGAKELYEIAVPTRGGTIIYACYAW